MFYLRIEPARTASALRSAANATDMADAGYTVEDGYVIVDTQAEANELISEYSNLALDLDAGVERSGGLERATIEDDGSVSRGETCETVKTDGDVCGRELPCQYHD